MFYKKNSQGYKQPIPGIRQKTLAYGQKTLMTEFTLKKDSALPKHKHPYEQTGYLVSGKMRIFIGDDSMECSPGDGWCIPDGMEHGADILEDSVAIEIFSPVREDYLPGK